jgi:hypothetical protein
MRFTVLALAALALNLLGFYALRTHAMAMLALCGTWACCSCPRHPVDHALCAWRSSIARAATRWRQG